MSDEPQSLLPQVIRPSDRRPASGLPSGSTGEEAFADPGAWVGFVELAPGDSSNWHHHGEWSSYAYVLAGVLRWEFGDDGREAIEVPAGGVGRMPAGLVHRDVSAGTEPLTATLFRAGRGPLTIDVAGPASRGDAAAQSLSHPQETAKLDR